MNKNDLVIVTPKNFYNKKYNEEFLLNNYEQYS